ncbi:hypothetical protein CU097_010811 [Rhizopus azygosporus]|uniref:Uncharacterized protein n=1 Tax=Rhizopus azygosporus TaxID=86630 RepID=A0A367JP37_RHIAZ|nr:hypothetical protein CU097_010811 [Rhizopus azygosporus]
MSIPQPHHHHHHHHQGPVEEYQRQVVIENPPPPYASMMSSAPGAVPYTASYQPAGGMGPNLVFNFAQQPYGTPRPPAPPGSIMKEEERIEVREPRDHYLVQGDPTWSRPRMPVRRGEPLRNEPCVIQ